MENLKRRRSSPMPLYFTGPVVRISPYELHVNDSTFFEKLYRQDGRWDKYDWSADAFGAPLTTVCSVAHDLHKRRRAPLNPLFSKSNVASKQDMIKRLIEKLCHRLDEAAGSQIPINLGVAISAFTRDASTDFMLGKSYNNLDKEDFNAAMTKTIIGLGTIWRITKHVPWVGPLMLSLPYSLAKKLGDDGIKAFFTFLESTRQDTMDIMAAAAAQTPDPEAPRTIVHGIMQSNLPQAEKTFNRVTEEVTSVAGAAFESTASAMRLILYYVYTDAVILQRLRDELASLRKRAGTVDHSWATLEQLPYLTGVLYEGLRRSPAIATRSARIAPDRDLICGEWHIPAGTPVGMTTLLMHRDEKLYPDPYRFDPERWVALETRKKADKTFVPFSRGTRNCLGMQYVRTYLFLPWSRRLPASLVCRIAFR